MKNFILVINKEKIYAYVLSICTIITLFFMSTMINQNLDESEETSSNIVQNTIRENKINENEINDVNNAM